MLWLHYLACRLTLVGRGQAVDRTGLLGQSAVAQSDKELESSHVVAVWILIALAGIAAPAVALRDRSFWVSGRKDASRQIILGFGPEGS